MEVGQDDMSPKSNVLPAMPSGVPMTDAEITSMLVQMTSSHLSTDRWKLVTKNMSGRTLSCSQAGALLEVINNGLIQRLMCFESFKGRLLDLPRGLPLLLAPLEGPLRKDVASVMGGVKGIIMAEKMADLRAEELNAVKQAFKKTGVKVFKPVKQLPDSPWGKVAMSAVSRGTSHLSGFAKSASSGSLVGRMNTADKVESIVGIKMETPAANELSVHVERLRAHVLNGQVAPAVLEDLSAVFQALGFAPLSSAPDQKLPGGGYSNDTGSPIRRIAYAPSDHPAAPSYTGNDVDGGASSSSSRYPKAWGSALPPSPSIERSRSSARKDSRLSEESV